MSIANFATIFAFGLRRAVRWRKVLLVAVLVCGIGALVGFTLGQDEPSLKRLARALERAILTFGLPLIALVLAADGYAFEVNQRTLVYHLVRPVSRATVFFARFFSGVVPATLVSTLFLASVVGTFSLPVDWRVWLSLPATAAAAAIALGAVYYTLGALFRHGLVAGLVYTFVVEATLSKVPGSMQKFSVMFHVRSLHHVLTEGVLPKVGPTRKRDMLGSVVKPIEDAPVDETLLVLLGITLVALAIGAWRVSRRDWALKE